MTEELGTVFQLAEGAGGAIIDRVTLTYDQRFLRRKRLTTDGGARVLLDLPETTSLNPGDHLALSDGNVIEVAAASEPILLITGSNLVRLAWHIGNRHTPCQVGEGVLIIRHDHVLAKMLVGLGAQITEMQGAFDPEGGAYGHGRTMGHDHGHSHDHEH